MDTLVDQIGYLKLEDIFDLSNENKHFGIYSTHKGTSILLVGRINSTPFQIHYPQKDRLPYKRVPGKKVVNCVKCLFDSTKNSLDNLDTSNWNNSEQIMSYQEY